MAFEKDLLTGKILSHLYPDEAVRIEGYQKIESRYSGYFDVIASNIPFGDVAVFDPQFSNHKHPAVKQSTQSIHNYFFTKSAQTAREGGIIAFITRSEDTRLNSSHAESSYAVFCLKKKKRDRKSTRLNSSHR